LPRYQVDAGFALGFGFGIGGYQLLRLGAAYRLISILLVGVAFEHTLEVHSMDDSCADGNFCPARFSSIGPRIELQPVPPWYVAPWIGAELDAIFLSPKVPDQTAYPLKSAVVGPRFDIGIEGRPVQNLAIGIYIADRISFIEPYERSPYGDSSHRSLVSLGARIAGRF